MENRKSREKKRICSEVSVNSPWNPWSHSILYYFTFLEKLLTNDIGVWPVKQSRVFRSTSVSKICWLLCTNVRGRVFVSKTAVVISASGGRC